MKKTAFFVFILAAAVLSLARALYVSGILDSYLNCTGCFFLPAFRSESWMVFAVLSMAALSAWLKPFWLALILRLGLVGLLVFSALDFYVFKAFSTRLFLSSIGDFGAEIAAIGSWLASSYGYRLWLYLAGFLALLWVVYGFLTARFVSKRVPQGLFVTSLPFLAFALSPESMDYQNSFLYRNVVDVNFSSSEDKAYSEVLAQRVLAADMPQTCVTGQARRDHVVVVIIESLSMYHSQFFSGLRNWTPELDKLARTHVAFTNFHASGFSTNEGLSAILAGTVITSPFTKRLKAGSFGDEWNKQETLPKILPNMVIPRHF